MVGTNQKWLSDRHIGDTHLTEVILEIVVGPLTRRTFAETVVVLMSNWGRIDLQWSVGRLTTDFFIRWWRRAFHLRVVTGEAWECGLAIPTISRIAGTSGIRRQQRETSWIWPWLYTRHRTLPQIPLHQCLRNIIPDSQSNTLS